MLCMFEHPVVPSKRDLDVSCMERYVCVLCIGHVYW
jgi:hypothetical protein